MMIDRIRGSGWLPSGLRSRAVALITAQAVVLDAGHKASPLARVLQPQSVRQTGSWTENLTEHLTAAMHELLQMMDDAHVTRQRLHLVVSDFFSRPAFIPVPKRPRHDGALLALITGHYRHVYGDPMADWRFCWQHHGGQLRAVAWPTTALSVLTNGLAKRQCVLALARPLGLEVATRLPSLPDALWLALISQQCASLFRLQRGLLQDWIVCTDTCPSHSVPLQLARSAALRDDDCQNLWVLDLNCADDTALLRQTLTARGWTWHQVSPTDLTPHWVWPLHPKTAQ